MSRSTLPDVLRVVHRQLARHRTEIDDLNVFPVPDGDTGTNMVQTVRAALEEASGAGDGASGEQTVQALARGAMRGARGNSGVILSQVIQALAEVLPDDGELDTAGLHDFLRRARELAYDAMSDPVEGTILTALTVAAETAGALDGDPLPDATRAVCDAVHDAVEASQGQLEVLRKAEVVDAGARGFEVVMQALHEYVSGEELEPDLPAPHVQRHGATGHREGGSLEYAFEVQYLLEADENCVPDLRVALERLGDSVAVVGAAGLLTVHVHTNEIGPAIEAGLEFGRPSRIEVVAFRDQIEAREQLARPGAGGEEAALACVAVLPGPGLRRLAEELGAVVVHGAAGDLPNVADLLNAVGGAHGRRVALLPGHPNAVPTARQAAEVSEAEGGRPLVVVSPADSPPAVLAALAVWAPDGDPDAVIEDLWAAAGAVRSAEVVAAVRDADTPVGRIRRGQYLAVVDRTVVAAADDPLEALSAALDGCCGDEVEVVTLSVGADVDDDERGRLADLVRDRVPGVEVELLDGGQRPARYLLGAE